jgi:hypothetical protein
MKINEFSESPDITDNDYLLLWDTETNATKNIKFSTIRELLGSASNPISTVNTSNLIFDLVFNTNGSITDSTGKTVNIYGTAAASNTRTYQDKYTLSLTGNSSDHLRILHNGIDLSSINDFSIEATIYINSEQFDGRTICGTIPGASNRGFNFALNGSRQLYFQSDGGSPTMQSSLTVPLNEWVTVKLAKRQQFYIFRVGSSEQVISSANSWQTSTLNEIYVGRTPRNDYPFPFAGSIGALIMEFL